MIDIQFWKDQLKDHFTKQRAYNALYEIKNNTLILKAHLPENYTDCITEIVQSTTGAQALVLCRYTESFYLNKLEMELQLLSGVPWFIAHFNSNKIGAKIISFGDHLLDEPVLGQSYMYGVYDCYSIIRRWYWQNRQIKLSEIPRNSNWWTTGADFYTDLFEDVGFKEIFPKDANELQVGDGLLIPLDNGGVPNHGLVYVGDNKVITHLPGHKSTEAPLGDWFTKATRIVRYYG